MTSDSRTDIILLRILDAINRLSSVVASSTNTIVAFFVVGTTPGAPTNGSSVWLISGIDVIGINPTFYINSVQLGGDDYTYDITTGTVTLLLTTFATGNVITVIY